MLPINMLQKKKNSSTADDLDVVTVSKEDEISTSRHTWGNKIEFSLATLGYCIGLGALTRFPYLVMKNGGGAFLIPFVIAMVIAGAPLFYLEILLGQFSGRSPLTMLQSLCPAFKGLGYSMSMLSAIAALYYMPFTWSMFFLLSSFNSDVPWRSCDNYWNTLNCGERNISANSTAVYGEFSNGSNETILIVSSPSEEFWNYYILGITKGGLSEIGSVRWQLALAHLFCWVVVFLCSMKGAVTAGKVVYVSATLPYLLLAILFVRGVTLEGSFEGIVFFLKPDFAKLKDVNVWIEAAVQVFYQLGPAWGGLITMASYNKFYHRCSRDAFMIPFFNLLTALFGGLAIFSILGFMARQYGIPVAEVAKSGPGLAFVAYPEAIAQMPLSPIWATMFFLMVISVAIDSQFGMFDTFVSGFLDLFPRLRRWEVIITACFALACYALSLLLCTEGGMYIYVLLDWYAAALSFTTIGFCECIIVSYVYGLKRFYSDVKLMLGSPPNKLVAVAWLFITPALLSVVGCVGLWRLDAPEYKFTNYKYPQWAVALGWGISFISFLPTPIMMIYVIAKTPGSWKEKLRVSFSPEITWLPNCPELVPEYCRKWYDGLAASTDKTSSGGGDLEDGDQVERKDEDYDDGSGSSSSGSNDSSALLDDLARSNGDSSKTVSCDFIDDFNDAKELLHTKKPRL